MKKLSDYEWNAPIVKELTFEQFTEKCDHMIKLGKAAKASSNEIKRLYEILSGNKIETLKSKKDE